MQKQCLLMVDSKSRESPDSPSVGIVPTVLYLLPVALSVRHMSKVWSKKWLKKKYNEELLNSYEIAEIANVSQEAVMRWVEKHDLERVERKERNKNLDHLYNIQRWLDTAAEVRERDGYQCQSCGTKQSELDRKLDVHHVRPVSKLADDGEITDAIFNKANLVSLCPKCHANKWEGIPVRPKLID